jgi:hypothetical protein
MIKEVKRSISFSVIAMIRNRALSRLLPFRPHRISEGKRSVPSKDLVGALRVPQELRRTVRERR